MIHQDRRWRHPLPVIDMEVHIKYPSASTIIRRAINKMTSKVFKASEVILLFHVNNNLVSASITVSAATAVVAGYCAITSTDPERIVARLRQRRAGGIGTVKVDQVRIVSSCCSAL